MTWTKCNPQDPGTYPPKYENTVFVISFGDGRLRATGYWDGWWWIAADGSRHDMERVTHWQSFELPPLPGEEPEPKAEMKACPKCGGSGRVDILRHPQRQQWVRCDECLGTGRVPLAEEQPKDDELARLLDYRASRLGKCVFHSVRDDEMSTLIAAARRALPNKLREVTEPDDGYDALGEEVERHPIGGGIRRR